MAGAGFGTGNAARLWIWALLLFRLFDIWKPGPVGWVDQTVEGGMGVMLDDVVAGRNGGSRDVCPELYCCLPGLGTRCWTPSLIRLAELILADARLGLKIATAESCTGGLLAAYFTEVPGSSLAFDRGFVTYSNEAKIEMLGVPRGSILRDHGAVSEPCARTMAAGALDHAPDAQDLAVAVTGIAGPGGGSLEKPVGLVHFGAIRRGSSRRP